MEDKRGRDHSETVKELLPESNASIAAKPAQARRVRIQFA